MTSPSKTSSNSGPQGSGVSSSATSFFSELAHTRRSARQFLPTTLPASDDLSAALISAYEQGRPSADSPLGYGHGLYLQRSHEHAAAHYAAHGIERSDQQGRENGRRRSLRRR